MSLREHAQSPLALRDPWPKMEQECPDDPLSLPFPPGRKSFFLVDGACQLGEERMCPETLLLASSHFGLRGESPGWSSMRPSRKGLESEEVDISCWEALHQVRATASKHLDWAGPSPPLWKHLEVPP